MSKFFEAALVSDADSCSVCESLEDSHRCITLEGSEIGGVSVSAEQLLGFFEHVYAVSDASGEWKAMIEKKRMASVPNGWPSEFMLVQTLEVSPANDSAKLRVYDLDLTYDVNMKGVSIHDDGKPKKLSGYGVGTWFVDFRNISVHPLCHLADYCQADCLMRELEKQAGIIVKLATDSKSTHCLWRILELADRYRWKDVRAACIPVCAKDAHIKTRPSWKDIARRVGMETMIELFEAR